MRVLVAIPCLMTGGTEMQTLMLSKVLISCGHTVIVVCYFEYEDQIVKQFQSTGNKVLLLGLNRELSFLTIIKVLRKEFKKINPDVVHIQYMAPGALPVIAARLAGIKTVYATVHQPFTKSHKWFSRVILNIASFFTTRFIAVSLNAEKSWFGKASLFDEHKPLEKRPRHFTIYNAVDVLKIRKLIDDSDSSSLRTECKIRSEIQVIGTILRLRYEKGADLLIRAFYEVGLRGIEAHLLIIGNGPDEVMLKEMAESLGLSGRVTFYGSADWETSMRLLSVMDIVVIPSRYEGFGLTAAEAMAAGKKVIASDSFGLKEIIEDNRTGLLFSTGDYSDLAQKLYLLLTRPKQCCELGEAGYRRILSLFSTEIFREKISTLYKPLV